MEDQEEERKKTDLVILMGDVTAEEIAQQLGKHVGNVEVEIISLKDAGKVSSSFLTHSRQSLTKQILIRALRKIPAQFT